jgi:hypothetical protein
MNTMNQKLTKPIQALKKKLIDKNFVSNLSK